MDGSIRFTQRDAIAAVIITAINIVGGLIIGTLQHGLDLATAAETYTILTIGEGLVTAIPALLVSVAGALITTRAASEAQLGAEVATQLFSGVRPMAYGSGALLALALIPGLPKIPFIVVGLVLGSAAWANRAREQREAGADKEQAEQGTPADPLDAAVAVDPLAIEVGYALISLVDEKQGGTLLGRVRSIRRQIAADTGVVVPSVHIADNLQLGPRTYSILLRGVEVARGELFPDRLLAINPGLTGSPIEGTPTKEPAFGLPAWWIATGQREQATAAGYTVVDPTTALSTHLSETIRTYLPDLLTRQQTKEMLDRVAQTSPKLVEELVPKVFQTGDIQRVLRGLLRERVPVKDLTAILEAMADASGAGKDAEATVEFVRATLGRAICRQYQNDRAELPTISLAPALEERLLASVVRTDQGPVIALDPQDAQVIASRIARALESAVAQPVLLCSPALRPHLFRLFSRVLPHLGVLSHSEVPPYVRMSTVALID